MKKIFKKAEKNIKKRKNIQENKECLKNKKYTNKN